MVKGIIFDCFGVLATEGWLPFKARHFKDPAQFSEAGDLMKRANSGLISLDIFLKKIAKLAHTSPADVLHQIRSNVPNEPLFEYINKELKPHYKIGFLSNVADDYMRRLFSEEQRSLFDCITLSYKTGFIKPDPRAYQIAAENLALQPEECVLVDDSPDKVAGARRAGMQAIHYRDFKQFKTDLKALLANPKS